MPLDMVKFMGENQFGFFFVKATFRQTGDQASLTHSDGERCVNAGRVTQPKGMRQVVNTDIPGHFFPQLQQMWIAYRVRTDFQRSVKRWDRICSKSVIANPVSQTKKSKVTAGCGM